MAELVDALVLGTSDLLVRVQVPLALSESLHFPALAIIGAS